MNSYERRLVHNAFKDDPDVATWSPSDSARIKQITLLKRQPKKEAGAAAVGAPGRRLSAAATASYANSRCSNGAQSPFL